ncbi:MAG: hypothetical protein NVSMB25_02780 [Thermoleophilaceae bacterium]
MGEERAGPARGREPSVSNPPRSRARTPDAMEPAAAHEGPATLRGVLERVRRAAGGIEPREAVRALLAGYHDNDLLTYASAIAFQVLFALVPLLLFALGLFGAFSLQDVFKDDIAPVLRPEISAAAFTLIDSTVTKVLNSNHLFWATFGAAIAVWEISGAMRAVMQVFNRIYSVTEDRRPFARRMLISLGLAAASAVLVIVSVVVARFGPLLVETLFGRSGALQALFFVIRWVIVISLLLFLVGLLVRFAPDCARPLHWVSFGASLTVFAWVTMSLVFTWYLTTLADYGSIFGSLATLIVVMEYLYLSAIVFLTGVQLDALIRRAVEFPGRGPLSPQAGGGERSD